MIKRGVTDMTAYVPRVNSLLGLDCLSIRDEARAPYPWSLKRWEGLYGIDPEAEVYRLVGDGLLERESVVIAFRKAASSASYHYADDSAREWHLAKPYVAECQKLYDDAEEPLKSYLIRIKGDYMIALRA
jgi:hypothetical protein